MVNQSENGNIFSIQGFSYSNLESLLLFADAKSVTAAANSKNRDAGTISRHIKNLDDFFGCKLRQTKEKTAGLSLEGEELVSLLRRQLKELEDFREKHTKTLHSVSLAGGDSLIQLFLLPSLSAVQKQFERTTISVSAARTFEIIQGLQNYSIDLGLLRTDAITKNTSLESEDLGEYRYAIFIPKALCPKDEVVGPDVFKLPFAMIKDHWDTDFIEIAKENGVCFENVRIFCENFTEVFRLVGLGNYAGILPIFCKRLLRPDTHCYEPFFLNERKHKVALAWNPSRIKSLLPNFIDVLGDELKLGFFPGV